MTNESKSTAYDVQVFDPTPEGLRVVEVADSMNYDSTVSRNGVGWLIDEMAPGETAELEFTAEIVDGDVSTLGEAGRKVIRNRASWTYVNAESVNASPPSSDEEMDNLTNTIEHPLVVHMAVTGRDGIGRLEAVAATLAAAAAAVASGAGVRRRRSCEDAGGTELTDEEQEQG